VTNIAAHTDPIAAAIYTQYEKRNEEEESRGYLGASIIGRECSRALWYGFRWAGKEQFNGQLLRLFETGHLAEPRFVENLRSIGATIHDVDPSSGSQFGFSGADGHMKGHMDGCGVNIPTGGKQWHVLEFKTHNTKSFAALKKHGVEKSKPEHYAQMTWYMGKSGMTRALYGAVNKDTDELYFERIEFDPVAFEKLNVKAESIIFTDQPPEKLSQDPKFYLCGWCANKDVCHGGRVPAVSCRTCIHATPERGGNARWSCAKHGPEIPIETQRQGCANHLPLPWLVTFANPIDAGEGWILFVRNDDQSKEFVVTDDHQHLPGDLPARQHLYTSRELSAVLNHRDICAH